LSGGGPEKCNFRDFTKGLEAYLESTFTQLVRIVGLTVRELGTPKTG